ncbi:MAG: hypothetical protein IPO63_01650 [Bacteroidetes bacterium]|nr:hypothetical protein [Bacteroidota bacterium]
MKYYILYFIFLLNFYSCNNNPKSELADPPCVIVIPESNFKMVAREYNMEIILNCNKPDSINKISLDAKYGIENSEGWNEKPYKFVKLYQVDGRLFCKFRCLTIGPTLFKGNLHIANDIGDTISHSFEHRFLVVGPDVVIGSNNDKYFYRGKENHIHIAASGYSTDNLIVKSPTSVLTRFKFWDLHYVIKPTTEKEVVILVYGKTSKDTLALSEYRYKVLDEDKNSKN